jgi:hypothetical protein
MILIDQPFVSDFLIQTIRANSFRLVGSPEARKMIDAEDLHWVPEKEAVRMILEYPETPLYTNSENALSWLDRHLNGSDYALHAELFKNKAKFRKLVQELYPGFFFKTLKLEEVQSLNIRDLPLPFVIKPAIGFFSIGVHVVRDESSWCMVKKELTYRNLASAYPGNVLDTSTFIIEEYIEGEEFAVDCYFNDQGEVVILNILHHRFSSGADTSDRVYTTSEKMVRAFRSGFENFLQSLGEKAGISNFPAHVELRVDASGRVIPIEVNPMRFGGWCTTADLLGLATGANPYEYYLHKRKPDWDKVFEGKRDRVFSIIVLNNNSGYNPDQIESFDYGRLAGDFEKPLEIRKMDVKKYAVFGFVFTETRKENQEELDKILMSDLRKYIRLK